MTTQINIRLDKVGFEDFWKWLRDKFKTRQKVINWTAASGETGENFEATFNFAKDKVSVFLLNKSEPILVSKDDFKFVYEKWNDYCKGNIQRKEFSDIRTSKYVISIIHQFAISRNSDVIETLKGGIATNLEKQLKKIGIFGIDGEKWKTTVAFFGFILLFLVFLSLAFSDTSPQKSVEIQQTPTPTITSTSIPTTTQTPTTIPPPAYSDGEYLTWGQSATKILGTDSKELGEFIKDYDSIYMELYGKRLKDDAQKYLDEIKEFTVSPALKPSVEEYEKVLNNYLLFGKYVELGAKNANAGNLELAADNLELAHEYQLEVIAHLKRHNYLLQEYNRQLAERMR